MGEVAVDRAGKSDLNAAWTIVSEYYDAVGVEVREDPEAFAHYYFGEGSGVWLARVGAEVVGCIALRPLDRPPQSGEVKRLYVRPTARGQGIAGLLLDALHEYATAAGYRWLYLDSKDDLETAIRFYQARGYQPCERYNDNPQATVFMRRPL